MLSRSRRSQIPAFASVATVRRRRAIVAATGAATAAVAVGLVAAVFALYPERDPNEPAVAMASRDGEHASLGAVASPGATAGRPPTAEAGRDDEEVPATTVERESPKPTAPVVKGSDLGALSRVVKVVDGDTIWVEVRGGREKVRLIGIDSPETQHPNAGVECFGFEASAYATQLLSDAQVHLVRDGGQDDQDQYGRLLRFVYLEDGTNVNAIFVRKGFATFADQYPVNEPWRGELEAAHEAAIAADAGLWSACR